MTFVTSSSQITQSQALNFQDVSALGNSFFTAGKINEYFLGTYQGDDIQAISKEALFFFGQSN